MEQIILAIVNNLPALFTALGGFLIAGMQTYTIFQNWQAHRDRKENIKQISDTVENAKDEVKTLIKNGNGHN